MTGELMPRRDQIAWAKEEVLGAVDLELRRMFNEDELSVCDEMELIKQRNRVAKLFNLPPIDIEEV